MRLLIDLRACHFHQERGIPNYAQTLALTIARSGRADCSFLVHRGRPKLSAEPVLRRYGPIVFHEDIGRVGAPACDAFFLTSLMYGLDQSEEFERLAIPPAVAAHRPMVCAILYDLIPLIFKHIYLRDPGTARAYMTALHVLRRCDHLFAISDASADDAVRLAGISPSRITTINGGIDRNRWARRVSPGRDAEHRTTEVIYIGGEDPRKNMTGVIRGFGLFKRRNPNGAITLTVVCSLSEAGQRQLEETLASEGLESGRDVDLAGFLSHEDLVERVSRARASIFPSLYEGLGLPVLESYSVDTPVFGSETSSVGPLIQPECRFDPHSIESIAEAFGKIDRSPDLLQRSVEFGKGILPRFDWRKSGNLVLSTIAGYLANRVSRAGEQYEDRPVAIFGPVSPERTGVGFYNSKVFCEGKRPIVIFTQLDDERWIMAKNADLARGSRISGLKLAPIAEFSRYFPMDRYRAAVFVIGNSEHGVPALKAAIDHRPKGTPRVLHLHEARVTGLLLAYFGGDILQLVSRLAEYYPELRAPRYRQSPWDVMSSHIMGVRLLLALTGVDTFFVNSQRCKGLIDEELSSFASCSYEVLFLPVLQPPDGPVERIGSEDELLIGHFGIIGPPKRPEMLIEAARIISCRHKVRLLFAGYSVSDAIRGLGPPPFVECVDHLSDDRLLSLMRGVDIAVQPREPDHGESSGVINQLISVGKRPVTSAGTAADDLGELVVTVRRGADAAEWATTMLNTHALPPARHDLRHLSVSAYGEAFDRAIDRVAAN